MKQVVGYVRVSTEEQAREGLSLGEQEHRIHGFASERGWECLAVHADRGVSGSVPLASRPAGAEAFATGLPIVVSAWDRLGRDAADFLAAVRDREVHSVSEQGEPPLLRDLRAVLAQEERRKIAERTRAAAGALFRAGRYNGPAPLGYRFEDGTLVVVAHEAEIVRRIFADYSAGRSLSAIARALNAEGIKTKRGGIWRQATIGPLLANPVYVGRVRLGSQEAAGVHEAIIDPEVHRSAQRLSAARVSVRGKGSGRPPKLGHLFTGGTLRCGECGQGMVPRSGAAQRGRPHYLCGGRQNLGCSMPYVDRRLIDSAVYAYFEQVGLDVEATREAIAESRNRKLAETRALLGEAESEAQRASERLRRVRRAFTDGEIDASDWREFRFELGAEHEAAEAEVSRLSGQLAEVESWAVAEDAERETLQRLAEIRAAIVGDVREAEGVEAVRAALTRQFDGFTLHRSDSPKAPKRLHGELAMLPGLVIEPHVREQAIDHEGVYAPVLRGEPVANNQRQGVGYAYLLSPILVA